MTVMSKTEPDTVRYYPLPHGDMALRCGLNTWSVHAVLEHAACTPRSVHAATRDLYTRGSVHVACTLGLSTRGLQTVCQIYLHTQCIQTALSTRSSWCGRRSRQYKHFTKRHYTQYGRRGCTVSS